MKYNKNFFLLVVILIVCIISIIIGLSLNWALTYKLYIGLSLLIICFILSIFKVKNFITIFGILLILSVFSFTQLVSFGFGLQVGLLKFELIPTIFFMLFLYLNRVRVLDELQDWFTTSDEEKGTRSNSKYQTFKKDFENLSDMDIDIRLNQIIVAEARKALIEIKEERGSKK